MKRAAIIFAAWLLASSPATAGDAIGCPVPPDVPACVASPKPTAKPIYAAAVGVIIVIGVSHWLIAQRAPTQGIIEDEGATIAPIARQGIIGVTITIPLGR